MFFVIGGVYVVDALVFGAAALLHTRRQQRRRFSSVTTSGGGFVRRGSTRYRTPRDVCLTSVDATPTVSVPPLFSTYGAVVAKAGTTGQPIGAGGKTVDDGERQ